MLQIAHQLPQCCHPGPVQGLPDSHTLNVGVDAGQDKSKTAVAEE